MEKSKHNLNIGKIGETLAAAFFVQKGFTVLFRNWRYSNWEVDLILSKKDVLHFVEVKTRTSTKYGMPESAVTQNKMRFLQNAADAFLALYPEWTKIQFDVLAILLQKDLPTSYFLNEDVYF